MYSAAETKRVRRRSILREMGATLVVVGAVLALNFAVQNSIVQDWWKGFGYAPSEKVQTIEEALDLTGTGKRIFAATNPVVEASDSFNEHCDSHGAEVSLLGCYTDGRIYIYEITLEQLVDSNKVTAAHELLHAAWQRMGAREREEITEVLREVYNENYEWFEGELRSYNETDRIEEVYTRAGTKLRNLPEKLEQNYAKYFNDRQKIVGFYENYQAPFKELQEKNEELRKKILATKDEIIAEREKYMARAAVLETKIERFRTCADQAGCFVSEEEFNRQREELVREQGSLDEERERLNQKIGENNARVDEYQLNQAALGELSEAMDSHVLKEET